MIQPNLEPEVRRILASLRPDETLTTKALALRLTDNPGPALSRDLVKLADNVPGLCTRRTEIGKSGYMRGKTVRPCTWHHIASPDMPSGTVQLADMRSGDTATRIAGGNPHTQSSGAASPATSLAADIAELKKRLTSLEEWRTRVDPLASVL